MKKLLVLLAALVLLVACTACSQSSDLVVRDAIDPKKEDPVTADPATSAPVTEAPSAKPEITTEPAQAEPEKDAESIQAEPIAEATLEPERRYKSGKWEYMIREDGKTAKIFYFDDIKSTSLTLPSELDGIPVTATGGLMFRARSKVTSVKIPAGIVTFESNPFSNLHSLTTITVDEGHPFLEVTGGVLFDRIEKSLISYPRGLLPEEYTIPEGTEAIGNGAFAQSSNLRDITIPESVVQIGKTAFCGCDVLKSIHLPEGLKELGESAFYDCNWLKEVNIPSGVTRIPDSCFMNCTSLETFVIPDHVTEIGREAFMACNALKSVTIPASVTSIGPDAFDLDTNLTIRVQQGSYAEQYCSENSLSYEYID